MKIQETAGLQKAGSGEMADMLPPRPRSVTVFGTANIIIGSLGIFCSLPTIWAIIRQHGIPGAGIQSQAVIMIMVVGLAMLGVLAIYMGLGLLRQKMWARTAAIVVAWIIAIQGMLLLIGYISAIVAYATRIDEVGMHNLVRLITVGMIVLSFMLVYPVLFVVFMSKPRAVAACSR